MVKAGTGIETGAMSEAEPEIEATKGSLKDISKRVSTFCKDV